MADDDGLVVVDALAVCVVQWVLIGVHQQYVPSHKAVVAEADLLGANDGALGRHVESIAKMQFAAHANSRAVPDGCLAFEIYFTAHLPDGARVLAVIMSNIAKTNLDHGCRNPFREVYLAAQLAQIGPM